MWTLSGKSQAPDSAGCETGTGKGHAKNIVLSMEDCMEGRNHLTISRHEKSPGPIPKSHIVQGTKETLGRGNVKSIVVSMEDRMGGRKHLTHLSHVEGFGLDPDELAAVLQKKWSTSCRSAFNFTVSSRSCASRAAV